MDGYTITTWELAKKKAAACNVEISVKGGGITIKEEKRHLGVFDTVHEAFAFLCGYEYYTELMGAISEK
jgi:hypothetical protein